MIFKKLLFNKVIIFLIFLAILSLGVYSIFYFEIFSIKSYTSEDFGIAFVKSNVDFNNNGIDDYTDILEGAKLEAKNHPKYDGKYFEGGYPPDNIGVCSDLIWRAFKNARYCLRDMVDKDIRLNKTAYPNISRPNKDIDFRRVRNLDIFFKRHVASLTTDPNDITKWQAGDIIVYKNNHIAVASDKRNKNGLIYIIHNYGQYNFEENALKSNEIIGHYRFDTKLVDKEYLLKWK